MNRTGCAGRPFIHDPLDSVSAAAALGAASEAGIDLAHAGPSRLFVAGRHQWRHVVLIIGKPAFETQSDQDKQANNKMESRGDGQESNPLP